MCVNGIYLYFVNKHLPSLPLLGLKRINKNGNCMGGKVKLHCSDYHLEVRLSKNIAGDTTFNVDVIEIILDLYSFPKDKILAERICR